MGRWEPNASGRLREAALDLYVERGFEQTTVAEIAARAGLTARTFFRHFADKREVLFAGSAELEQHLVDALVGAPAEASPMDAIGVALDAGAASLGGNRELSRRRRLVIAANGELQERELIKMTRLATALADGLRRRGVDEADARLAAEAGVSVFRVAFERWVTEPEERALPEVMRESFDRLRSLSR
ncbi:TetR/AcrR family transcriptional regulator [Pseudonocardia kujensis]|uniref:TetR family transcriptional regulator n=1 Tax=Pseudonocardia kujensis TaxID=1128675 RepID=UPI001E2DB7EE|nr:TetR family transcriptional regulator [Pseudonocardia kujensis]MCE0762737.1 TetR/AcrR family transcriptional regulator [Pseudonocardia kujensis]